jgi:hypothetical protein
MWRQWATEEYDMTERSDIFEQVVDTVEGRADDATARRVSELIVTDQEWRAAHEWVSTFRTATDDVVLAEVPASTRAMLERLLPERRSVVGDLQQLVRHVARLVQNNAAGVAFAGARGASATRRQLVFEIEGADLVVDLACESDRVECSGQLLGARDGTALTAASDSGEIALTADEFGEFSCVVPSASFLRLDLTTATTFTTIDLTPFLDGTQGVPE